MASQKKFGFFSGVFTPSILTILGVIMYMRLGWVVGHAGLTGSIIIILIAHVISISTGLSISSIATNKKVGAGGVYYVLSRSLGLPMGGAIGYTLFIATSFSIALYLIGFAENFNPVLGMGSTINDFRVSGTLALLVLTILVYISTSVAIKSQYFILGAIILSLVAVFAGDTNIQLGGVPIMDATSEVSFAVLFGVFFPAVTGFTAGIAMSGDLKDPKKDIPIGTMLAIGVGLLVYISLAVFLNYAVPAHSLQNNYNILMDIALFAPLVIAGIWGATLSSALGGLLGGPRIFQAMSVDNITPFSKIFASGEGKSNEPRNALILTIIIAEVGVLIGELDAIARLVSMFYLMAYNFINISFFLESWANSDFSPKFKVNKWFGALGFIATFTVMFQIDPGNMVAAYILLFGLYFFLKRKEISLSSGDIWGSVWSSVVKVGLKRMDEMDENQNYWRPNILLFSGGTEKRPHLIEFSQDLGGRTGMVSNFDLIETPDASVLFPKGDKGASNAEIMAEGIFTRRQKVKNLYTGIQTIASIYGFSGIEPNSVLMGWARNTKDPKDFARLTQSLIDLDYNVLYLDYDTERKFGKYETIDLWWRGISNNVVLMIKLVKFILASQRWRNANVRVLLVNDDHSERTTIVKSINEILVEFRLSAEIKIINNSTEKLSIFDLMKHYSSFADLVFVGVPDKIYDESKYVSNTNNLLNNIGTTLMVRASSQFTETRLGITPSVEENIETVEFAPQAPLVLNFNAEVNEQFTQVDESLKQFNQQFTQGSIASITNVYVQLFTAYCKAFEVFFKSISEHKNKEHFRTEFFKLQQENGAILDDFVNNKTQGLSQILDKELSKWLEKRGTIFTNSPTTIKRILELKDLEIQPGDSADVRWLKREKQFVFKIFNGASLTVEWREMLMYFQSTTNLANVKKVLHDIGMIEAYNIKALRDRSMVVVEELLAAIIREPEKRTLLVSEAQKRVISGLNDQIEFIKQKPEQLLQLANNRDRNMVLKMVELMHRLDIDDIVEDLEDARSNKATRALKNEISEYPQFWSRNQLLFSNLYRAWVVTTGLQVELVFLREKVANEVRFGLFGLFKRVSTHLSTIFNKDLPAADDDYTASAFDENELLSHNPADLLARIHEELRDNIRHLPEEIDLLNEDSVLNFEDFQEAEVEQITIDLRKIADYYIDLDFIEPLNRGLTHTYTQITGRFEELNHRIGYINELKANGSTEGQKQIEELQEKLKVDIQALSVTIANVEQEFLGMLDRQFSEISSKLSVSELLSTSANPVRFIHIKKGYLGIFDQVAKWTKESRKWVNNWTFEFRRKKHQLRIAEFNDRNKTLVNKRKQFRDFVEQNSLSQELSNKLPTYYKHLFSGKQVFNKQMAIERSFEMNQAVSALNNEDSGGVMIISESLAGKSHFLESLLQQLQPSKTVRITAPIQGISDNSSLLTAFQDATDLKGNFFSIMSALPPGTVFVFNKLELWWLRKTDGGKLINQLVWLIERYGNQHHFVMSMNIYAYDLVRQVTKIDSMLSATIMIPPANTRDMAELMFDRHQLAGITIVKSEHPDHKSSKREIVKLMEKFASNADGNIGVAMLRWLAHVEKLEDNTVYVKEYEDVSLPSALPLKWAVLLTQLVLHQNMHINNMVHMFSLQDKSTVHTVIKELVYTKLIKEVSKNTYAIEPFILKSVIDQLKAQNFLKKFE